MQLNIIDEENEIVDLGSVEPVNSGVELSLINFSNIKMGSHDFIIVLLSKASTHGGCLMYFSLLCKKGLRALSSP